jgi:hypothetical protein
MPFSKDRSVFCSLADEGLLGSRHGSRRRERRGHLNKVVKRNIPSGTFCATQCAVSSEAEFLQSAAEKRILQPTSMPLGGKHQLPARLCHEN